MGCVPSITFDRFPKQAPDLHTRVRVCFHYRSDAVVRGTIVRNDSEDPFRMIIRLDDGRYVLATECQYAPEEESGWRAHVE